MPSWLPAFKYQGRTSPHMLAIAGGKGGCGKTTTTVGLARTLARGASRHSGVAPSDRATDRPLVVDADSDMPDVHHVAEVSREPGIDQLVDGQSVNSVTQSSERFPGVRVLTTGRRGAIADALGRIRSWDGPVLVDCPPGSSPDAVRPLRHADAVLIVTTDEPASLDDAARTVRTARRLGTQQVGVVMTRRTRESPPSAVGGCQLIATAPFVSAPFSHQQVERSWERVVQQVWNRSSAVGTTSEGIFTD